MRLTEALDKKIIHENMSDRRHYIFNDNIREIIDPIEFQNGRVIEIDFNNVEKIIGSVDLSDNEIFNINFGKLKYIKGDFIDFSNNLLRSINGFEKVTLDIQNLLLCYNKFSLLDLSNFKFINSNEKLFIDVSGTKIENLMFPPNLNIKRIKMEECYMLKNIFFNNLKTKKMSISDDMRKRSVKYSGKCAIEISFDICETSLFGDRTILTQIKGPFNL